MVDPASCTGCPKLVRLSVQCFGYTISLGGFAAYQHLKMVQAASDSKPDLTAPNGSGMQKPAGGGSGGSKSSRDEPRYVRIYVEKEPNHVQLERR